MNTDTKKPKSLQWFEPPWSYRPRLKQELACVFNLWTWVRIFVVALLLVALLALVRYARGPQIFNSIGQRPPPTSWLSEGIVLSIAAFIALCWFVPPRVGINAKGVCLQQGNHASWLRHSDIRCIILDRTLLEEDPRLCVQAAGKKEFNCGIAWKIGLDSLAAFLREIFPDRVIEERK